MKLGVDFGTTRIVVAAADRGNYPVISFEDQEGNARDWFPPLVAFRGEQRLYGWDAWAAQANPEYTVVRSLKRTLEEAGPATLIDVDGAEYPVSRILEEMARALRQALIENSSLPGKDRARLEAVLGIPANAHSNQRFLTADAFQRAGFHVLGLLNEPSAASIEFGHGAVGKELRKILVYDLGGGTFDASLVEVHDRLHVVAASEGINALGGDDFDVVLAEMALIASSLPYSEAESITQAEMFRLHEECRARKESLGSHTRRITVDLGAARDGWPEVSITTSDFYEQCRPMVNQSIALARKLLEERDTTADVLYITGGGSELPLIARSLKEVFGRRVKRSAYTRSATAIGLAIHSDQQAGYLLREKFTRHFGVWREAESGRELIFDRLFEKGAALPAPGEAPIEISRSYYPVHNIGHFRYLECSERAGDTRPAGDISLWDEIRFPFDPALREEPNLDPVPVGHSYPAASQQIRESYSCDAMGMVVVRIENMTSGYARSFQLGRWAGNETKVAPGKARKVATGRKG